MRGCLLLLSILLCGSLAAETASTINDPGDEPVSAYLKDLEEDAAAFRLSRAGITIDPTGPGEVAALKGLRDAQSSLDQGESKYAFKLARKAFNANRWSATDETLGHLLRLASIGAARADRVYDARTELGHLWFYLPGYDQLGEAMSEALACAERAQNFTSRIDLDAPTPQEVVDIDGSANIQEAERLFHFLSTYGDKATVGARAELGLARAALLGADRRDLSFVRLTYEDFLAHYPTNDLTFTALCELAVTWIAAYKGKDYDVGALINAQRVIDQAEIEAGGVAEHATLVARYRTRIRGWMQDRDLSVARWYRNRQRPAFLAWLKEPSDYDWTEAARFYYNETVHRDPSTPQGRAAARELADLPPPERDPIGADLLPNR